MNNAVARLANLGVVVAVAAGNDGRDARCVLGHACCFAYDGSLLNHTHTPPTPLRYTSPASASSAFTVSATDQRDTRASWANYGSVVDIYAPGVNINSASYQGDQYYVR